MDAVRNPLKTMWLAIRGPRVTGPMAPEINLSNQRPAVDVHEQIVEQQLERKEAA